MKTSKKVVIGAVLLIVGLPMALVLIAVASFYPTFYIANRARTMYPVGRLAPLKFMRVFVRSDGEWRLLSLSLTPCVDMLVRIGRC
ncbi:MAG: hypothetical protein IH877_03380 [Gemmatimonadetes bacterium]|nr:hypothetical protein [Gemmatimonadota bacterium]